MAHLLDIKPYRQRPAYCGPSSLKMILAYYGIKVPELKIAKMAKTTELGTKAEDIINTAKILGMHAYIKDNCTLSDIARLLEKGIPCIVDWFSQDDGHYSVVIGLDDKKIYLQDPELGKVRTIDRHTFLRVWFDFKGEMIKSKKDMIIRRIIVVYPDPNKSYKNKINK